MLLPETPGHSQASMGQSPVGSLLLSPGSWCIQCFAWALLDSMAGMWFDSKHDFAPPIVFLGLLLFCWMCGVIFCSLQFWSSHRRRWAHILLLHHQLHDLENTNHGQQHKLGSDQGVPPHWRVPQEWVPVTWEQKESRAGVWSENVRRSRDGKCPE